MSIFFPTIFQTSAVSPVPKEDDLNGEIYPNGNIHISSANEAGESELAGNEQRP